MKWLIYKRGPRDWRVTRGGGVTFIMKTHAECVRHMNNVVAANRYAAVAA